jgi:arabinofuranan 3-O-arabinosyltransferase
MSADATSRLRMWGYCLVLTAVAFVQAPGRMVGDTKIDLVVDPWGFLARAARLWDPTAAFGQVQNQAYGYFWPMGPFFLLGDLVGLSPWVVQRLWWALLLCVAFVGVVKLARALGLGVPWTQVVAGFAFALSAHVLTLLGPTSIEAWPTAWAPWVLLPLVSASRTGSVRRGAALSALAVAMCGGVNAVAVSAVLPLAVLWLLTREAGPRSRRLIGWWVLFTMLATLWWWVPLLLLGRYSVPFLDYIENAPITTLPTSLPDILGGTSDWVAYIAVEDWAAGHLLGTTPFLLVNLAVVAGAGLAGALLRDNPHRHFLFLGVLAGVVLVGFGYTGPLQGWWAAERLALLDAELAPFRNLHKYDVVLRLALVLGLAHFLATVAAAARESARPLPHRMVALAVVVSVGGAAVPAYAGKLPPSGPFERVPDYWQEAADFVAEADRGVALVVPATAFGDYRWGSPRDDIMQPLARSPWAVRNIIPLAQPGNVRLLDAVTRELERSRPSRRLAEVLAANGVGHLVVRNDVQPFRSAPPHPVVLHQALDRSPGLTKVAEFGPDVGESPVRVTDEGLRVLLNRGRQAPYAAVEVYAVQAAQERVTAWRADTVPVVAGGPAEGLAATDGGLLAGPSVLVGDRTAEFRSSPTVLTDGLRRREMAFTAVRDNESATMTEDEPWTLRSVQPNHRLYDEQEPYETHAAWIGVAGVQASSAQAEARAAPPIRTDRLAAAAFDGDLTTQWVSAGVAGAEGQWWRVTFDEPIAVPELTVTTGTAQGAEVSELAIVTDRGRSTVEAPSRGRSATYELDPEPVTFVEIRASASESETGQGLFALAEVEVPGVEAERVLVTPDVFEGAPEHVLLAREPDRLACAVAEQTRVCDDLWRAHGEEKNAIRRVVTTADAVTYAGELTASVRPTASAAAVLADALPVRVRTSKPVSSDVTASGLAVLDGDPGTAWVAAPGTTPSIRLAWDDPVRLQAVEIELPRAAPGARPQQLLLKAGRDRRTVDLQDGRGTFRPLLTDEVVVEFPIVEQAYSLEGGRAVPLTVGVAELSFPGAGLPEVDPERRLDLGCGTGPTVAVNGAFEETAVEVSLAEIMSDAPLRPRWCDEGAATMQRGENVVRVLPSALAAPEKLALTEVGVRSEPPSRVASRVERWTATHRAVRVAARDEPTLLVVNENLNPGWSAAVGDRTLPVQRVDGWRQGWVLAPGPEQVVRFEFVPDRAYRTALFAGADALLVVLAAALPLGRRPRYLPAARTSPSVGWIVALGAPVAGGLVAGWIGFVAFLVAVLVGRTLRAWRWAPYGAGAALALAGLSHAFWRADLHDLGLGPGQSLGVVGLSLAVAALGAKGPELLRRRKGRSRTW